MSVPGKIRPEGFFDRLFIVHFWAQEHCGKEGLSNDEACVDLFTEVSESCQGKIERNISFRCPTPKILQNRKENGPSETLDRCAAGAAISEMPKIA